MLIAVEDYVHKIESSIIGIDDSILEIYKAMVIAKDFNKRILVLGNGGSLAIAQHFAQDLLKLCGIRAMTINCPSLITAHANDDGFEYSFFNPAMKLIDEDDLIFIFSCSGKSRNYIEFVSGFPNNKNEIISVVGTDGGFLKTKSTFSIHVKSNDYQVCETAFCVIADILVKSLLEE